MKKINIIIAIILLSTSAIFAQVPNAINFQAIARDANGDIMSNTDIMIRLTVLDGSATGTEVYQELRALTTNGYGSFSFQIGRDADYVTVGTFTDIDWNTGNKFLKLDYDPSNQFNWDLTLGTIEFVSVPFAFSANTVTYIDIAGVQDGDALLYNAATGKFEPGQISGGTVTWSNITGTAPNVSTFPNDAGYLTSDNTISDLADVNTSGATNGQVLSYNGTNWLPSTVSSSSSLWTQNGDDIYFNSGNIGIGTNNPDVYRLLISGNEYQKVRIESLNHDARFEMIRGDNFHQSATVYGTKNSSISWCVGENHILNEKFSIWSYDGTSDSHKFVIDNSGNIGVNTTNPTSKLQVVGLPEYTDNAAAVSGGLTVGAFYRTGDLLKVVH